MAILKEFMDAVQSGDQMSVRIMLKNSLLIDPTTVQFEEMGQYANQQMRGLYDEHDGEALNFDVSSWTKDYLDQQMFTLVDNFSKERVDLLKSMVQYLYKEKASKIRSDRNAAKRGPAISRKEVGIGVTAAGALLAVGAACMSQPALAVGGGVVAVVGIALIATDRGDSE